MNPGEGLLLLVVGIAAGIANVVAGGGSLLSVPAMHLLGLPIGVANATSRPAIVAQNAAAVFGFRRRGIYSERVVANSIGALAICTIPGGVVGAWVAATKVSDDLFRRLLGVVLVGIAIVTWRKLRRRGAFAPAAERRPLFLAATFFGLGLYGGFIQAGVGFLIIAALAHGTDWTLVRINAAKVAIVLVYSVAAILVYTRLSAVDWAAATWLLAGQTVGGFAGARLVLVAGERRLLAAYFVLLLVFAATLIV